MSKTFDTIIIGGGLLGCATAYYLAKIGKNNIALFERNNLGAASSSRAAGLMTMIRSQEEIIPFVLETYKVIAELESILNYKISYRKTGSIQVGISPESILLIEKLLEISSKFLIESEIINSSAVKELVPWLELPKHAKILYTPNDLVIDPYDLTMAYAKAAQSLGVKIYENRNILNIINDNKNIIGIEIENEIINCNSVVVSAGAWSNILTNKFNFNLPMAPIRSQYWITKQYSYFECEFPFIILPDAKSYLRREINSLLFGYREDDSFSIDPRKLTYDVDGVSFTSQEKQWEYLIDCSEQLQKYYNDFLKLEIAHYIEGFSTYTPDGMFILDKSEKYMGLYSLTGCSGAGMSASGGLGLSMAELIKNGKTTLDISKFKANRFGGIKPFSKEFLTLCENARSKKKSG